MGRDMENLKSCVQSKFAQMRNALYFREKLLLRQAEVIMQQTKQQRHANNSLNKSSMAETHDVKFLAEMEEELLTAIRNFGRFQLDNINLTLQDVYLRNEDYITPSNDHETMYKCLQQNTIVQSANELKTLETLHEEEEKSAVVNSQPESIVVDFSCNKSLIEHNAKHLNKSIINITLQEAKELIKKAKMRREMPIPPLNLEELDDEFESSIAEAVSSLGGTRNDSQSVSADVHFSNEGAKATKTSKKSSSNRFNPKITINNCNGTINLRNISNLTINCATEDAISAQIPIPFEKQAEQGEDLTTTTTTPADEFNKVLSNSRNQGCNGSGSGSVCDSESTDTNANTQRNATVIEAQITSSTDDSPTTTTTTTTASSSNYSSSSSSRSQSKKQRVSNSMSKKSEFSQERTFPYGMVDYDDQDHNNVETHAVTCDFYNRLLKEIKNTLRTKRANDSTQQTYSSTNDNQKNNENLEATNIPQSHQHHNEKNSNCSSCLSNVPPTSSGKTNTIIGQSGSTSGSASGTGTGAGAGAGGRRLVLKNFENLRIVLEANSSDEESFRPVQIEQWLAEIISETDLEPMQNTDILEHSKIHNESS